MKHACLSQRIGANILNIFVGCYPLIFPIVAYYDPSHKSWARDESFTDAFSLGLAIMQWIIYYILSGSPGYACSGLKVQMVTGGKLKFHAAVIRSLPITTVFICIIAMPRAGSENNTPWYLVVMLIATFSIIIGDFIHMITYDGKSLMDRISKTVVIKSYYVIHSGKH